MFHRFYTLEKKPTVWNIAFLTVFMIIGMAVILTRQAISIPWFLAVYIVFHLAVLGMLIRAFFRQLRYDPYSYNTIYYSGFTILMLVYLLQVVFTNDVWCDDKFPVRMLIEVFEENRIQVNFKYKDECRRAIEYIEKLSHQVVMPKPVKGGVPLWQGKVERRPVLLYA